MTYSKSTITQEELHEWFDYDPDRGLFTWKKIAPRSRLRIGDAAGSPNTQHGKTRRVLWLLGRRIYAARAAYIYVHGDIPPEVLVDHADGDQLNDRISNLRLASTAQNVWNRIQRDGVKMKLGVSKGERGRFKARIQSPNGNKINLGTWATEEEAHAAYMGAAAILHSEFWVGMRPSRSAA
jgi:hypothetical protein